MEIYIMKFKLTALILALTVASWAQTASQNPPAAAPQDNAAPHAKADCACCDKMARAKEGQSCCHHETAGKDEKAMSCCSGEGAAACCGSKDAKSCMKGDKDKAATAACGDCCGKDHEKGCCASAKKGEKTAMNCCGGKQCGEHCAAHASAGAAQ
ncbi:MAG TPA: hypothetical protein VET69_08155 [Terriglobales bacterium]|nr:hypothetical protein [Terriglobales bacterium]